MLVKNPRISAGARTSANQNGIKIKPAASNENRKVCFIRSESSAPQNCAIKIAAAANNPFTAKIAIIVNRFTAATPLSASLPSCPTIRLSTRLTELVISC